jgi:hypothetical protein
MALSALSKELAPIQSESVVYSIFYFKVLSRNLSIFKTSILIRLIIFQEFKRNETNIIMIFKSINIII